MTAIAHATIVMERNYNASPERVFNAWADVELRQRWSAPADNTRIEYDEADFREEVTNGAARVSAALISIALTPKGGGRHLLLTMQIASFDGSNMKQGYQFGWGAALDNLAKEFEQ